MGIGEILDRSFQVLRRHLGTLVLTAVVGTAATLLVSMLMGGPSAVEQSVSAGRTARILAFMVMLMLISGVVWAGLCHQVDRAIAGGRVSVGDGLRAGLGALLRLTGAGLLLFLILLGLSLLAGMAFALSVGGGVGGSITATALVATGVVAAVILAGITFLILPALTIERLGPVKAVRRANALAKGGRIRVFATALLTWLVVLLPTIGIPALLGSGIDIWNPQPAGETSTTRAYLQQVLMLGASALTTPFMAAAMVHAYYDRRVRREGYDVQLTAEAMQAPV